MLRRVRTRAASVLHDTHNTRPAVCGLSSRDRSLRGRSVVGQRRHEALRDLPRLGVRAHPSGPTFLAFSGLLTFSHTDPISSARWLMTEPSASSTSRVRTRTTAHAHAHVTKLHRYVSFGSCFMCRAPHRLVLRSGERVVDKLLLGQRQEQLRQLRILRARHPSHRPAEHLGSGTTHTTRHTHTRAQHDTSHATHNTQRCARHDKS